MIDWSLFITIGLIFMVTLIGAYLRTRVKDRCLKSFNDFHVTLEMADGRIIWGDMKLEATGLELLYNSAVHDERHIESSYILYTSEFGNIQAIYRYADQLSEEDRKRREKDIVRSFHPGPFRRLARSLRLFLGTATDSLNEVMGIVLGRVQKTGGGRYLADNSDATLSKLMSGQVIGLVGTVHDPLLESHIGHRVVIELMEGNEIHEHVGILKEYSPDFIQVLDVQYPEKQALVLSADGSMESEHITVSASNGRLTVTNRAPYPILLRALECADGGEQLINAVVDSDEVIQIHPQRPAQAARLHVQVVRELDLIVPRSRCVVRHRAEHYKTETLSEALKESVLGMVFDVGLILAPDRQQDAQEERLREELKHNPQDALAAANLAALLIKKHSFSEAERLLEMALSMAESLPDGGRRARMQLRELKHLQNEGSGQRIHRTS